VTESSSDTSQIKGLGHGSHIYGESRAIEEFAKGTSAMSVQRSIHRSIAGAPLIDRLFGLKVLPRLHRHFATIVEVSFEVIDPSTENDSQTQSIEVADDRIDDKQSRRWLE